MQQGEIVERGNHTQLLSHAGVYAHLWELQQQEEEEKEEEQTIG